MSGLLAIVLAATGAASVAAQPVTPPSRARAINGQEGIGFNNAGFNAGGFNAGGFNGPGFSGHNLSGRDFSGRGGFGDGCGRMLVPAGSLEMMSRGFFPGHAGIDLAAPYGSPIRAAASGTISYMGTDPEYGLFIDIRHPAGLLTRYGHLSAFAPGLYAGSAVRGGTEIGRVGATGNAQGAHLHFEVRTEGRAIDPKPFLVGAVCPGSPAREELLEARAPDGHRQGAR